MDGWLSSWRPENRLGWLDGRRVGRQDGGLTDRLAR